MIFHREKKLCVFEPPKNGTQTARHFLQSVGWNLSKEQHNFPENFIAKYPNLTSYKFMCFLRNPLDRFVSCVLFFKRIEYTQQLLQKVIDENKLDCTIETMSYEQILPFVDQLKDGFKVMFSPQTMWFTQPNTEALDFDNYESEIRRISGATDVVKYPLIIKNQSTDFGKSVITDKVRAFVREYYAADYALAQERLGKDYA